MATADNFDDGAKLTALQEQLSRLQRSAALGELLGTTAHEFNNILMTVLNYARMGQRHTDQPTRDKCFEKIHAAASRAARITSSILGMARNRSASLEPTNLIQLTEDALLLLERELSKYRVSIDRQFASVPEVLACGTQIQQVLLNLLVNARQAMPSGGTVFLRVVHDAAAQTVDLTVRDTGCGIPAEVLPRIFDRYFTTKSGPDESGKGGTGLGLAACKEIIEAHRGRIRVESTPGRGTAFTIKLPVARPAAATNIPAISPLPAVASSPAPASPVAPPPTLQ